jgi:hypothetical protein
MLAAWELWKIRNDLIFNRHPPSRHRWFQNFKFQCTCLSSSNLFGWLVADGWCWFVLREEYCWLVGRERKVLLAGG